MLDLWLRLLARPLWWVRILTQRLWKSAVAEDSGCYLITLKCTERGIKTLACLFLVYCWRQRWLAGCCHLGERRFHGKMSSQMFQGRFFFVRLSLAHYRWRRYIANGAEKARGAAETWKLVFQWHVCPLVVGLPHYTRGFSCVPKKMTSVFTRLPSCVGHRRSTPPRGIMGRPRSEHADFTFTKKEKFIWENQWE